MKKSTIVLILFICNYSYGQIQPSIDSAYAHLNEQFKRYHTTSDVYSDDNAGGNIFIPSIWQGALSGIAVNQADTTDTFKGRSSTQITFDLNDEDSTFSTVKYVYPDNNLGTFKGFDMSGATQLSFYAKGSGTLEFYLGGMNRRPFYTDTLPFQDGVDIRSSGFVTLSNDWTVHTINLADNTFWGYSDSVAGLNNKYLQPIFMDHFWYFDFYYGADNGLGGTCMRTDWFGGSTHWAGVFLFPPEWDTSSSQGYDLTGVDKIHFKAKISETGNVKFLFGRNEDSSGQQTNTLTLSTDWQWYEWDLNDNLDYSNVVGGFGFFFGGDIGTPNNSSTYIDSVYYEGVALAGDFSNVICGFAVSANNSLNEDSAVIILDEIKYNKDRTEKPRFCQSYVCGSDSLDMTQKNAAHVYDNALKLIADLVMYDTTLNEDYLESAKKTGDAFVYAISHDRYFNDGRLRNVYMSGELIHYDSTVRMPGWWDNELSTWNEDPFFVSTHTGNMAWAGIALTSLFEETQEEQYLETAETIAGWCVDSTQTNNGFTGGFEGWGPTGQTKLTYKSTEHNIDLYVLFKRLFDITTDSSYYFSAQNAKGFVLSMWNDEENHFWTGTDNTGIDINTNPNQIPLDIQAWYIMAFRDNTSPYSTAIEWANQNCYIEDFISPNYTEPISGFDFNTDLDGIWFEGSAQAALANQMKGNAAFAEEILSNIEYVQNNHIAPVFYNLNNKGVVAADHNHITTGFDWEYHNRLHIGATCWTIFSKLGYNPFYNTGINTTGFNHHKMNENHLPFILHQNHPNPFKDETIISFEITENDVNINLSVYNSSGQLIKLLSDKKFKKGDYSLTWDGRNQSGKKVLPGVYLLRQKSDKYAGTKKITVIK